MAEQFRCRVGAIYDLPPEYIYEVEEFGKTERYFDVKKAYDNIDGFVHSMKEAKKPSPRGIAKKWTHLTPTSTTETAQAQSACRTPGGPVEDKELFAKDCWVYAPDNIDLPEHVRQRKRVVFTPSYKRHSCAFLNRGECKDTVFVLVVSASEEQNYRDRWGNFMPILVLPDEIAGIGSVRHEILRIAQDWGLPRCWVVDDSIIVNSLKQIERKRNEDTHEVEQTLKDLSFEEMFSELEVKMKEDDLCLISPTTLFSVWDDRLNRFKLNVDKRFETAIRAPTSIVLIDVTSCATRGIQYVKGLFSKEDILFAYSCLIKEGKICVHRKYCYEDFPFREGGVIESISEHLMSPLKQLEPMRTLRLTHPDEDKK